DERLNSVDRGPSDLLHWRWGPTYYPYPTHLPHPTCAGPTRPTRPTTMSDMSVRDVIIIGAGPSGLSAAIAAKRRGLEYQVLEQGVLVNSIYRFPPQMVFFTTPELLEI